MPEEPTRSSRENPYDSPSTGPGAPPPSQGFRDRRGALTAVGIVEILFGGLFFLFAVVSVLGQALSAQILEQEPNYLQAVPSAFFYLLLAAAMIAVGFGSIGAKRWARSLALILAWSWLVTGLLTVASVALFVPRALAAMPEMEGAPAGIQSVILVVALGVTAIFAVLVPGGLILFYRSRNVQATVEAYDRGPDLTSACPLPVLTLSLWMFVGGALLFVSPVAARGAFPFFGVLLSGVPGFLVSWAVAALWVYAAWGLYRMSSTSWWIVFVSSALLGISSVSTFLRVDLLSIYERAGYSQQQLDAIRQFGTLSGSELALFTAAFFVPYLVYLVYLKKYFQVIQ